MDAVMLLPVLAAMTLHASPPPVAPSPSDLEADVARWHQKRIERLKAEDGWLALVGLHWLDEGTNTVEPLGTFVRKGKTVQFKPAQDVKVTRDGKPFPGTGGDLRTDADGQKPDLLRAGTRQFQVIDRGERVGVRVRDSEAETRRKFKGIERFPVGVGWRKVARFEPAKPGATIPIPNVLGDVSEVPLEGIAVFTHEGKEYRLQATREGDSLFFVFGDLTNRSDTYGAGRFLYTDLPRDGQVVLDFNRAYNPPCAFTPYATCPLPTRENKLPIRIEAGEKRYGDH